MATWRDSDTPAFHDVETGIPLAPPYDYHGRAVAIDPTEWKHLCSARFGEARPANGRIKWTGDSYRYDIFERIDNIHTRHVALRWWNGGGQGWFLTTAESDRANLLDLIVGIADESQRWDYCHCLWQTASKSAQYGSRETEKKLKRAFVEGRLKKRKVRGQDTYNVTVTERTR